MIIKIYYFFIFLSITTLNASCSRFLDPNKALLSNIPNNDKFERSGFGKKKRFYTRLNMIEISKQEESEGRLEKSNTELFVKSEKFNDELNHYNVKRFINGYNKVRLLNEKPFRLIKNGNSKDFGFFNPDEEYSNIPPGNIDTIKEIEKIGIIPADNESVKEIIYFNKRNDYEGKSCKGIKCYAVEETFFHEDEDFSAYDTYRKKADLDDGYDLSSTEMYNYDPALDIYLKSTHSPSRTQAALDPSLRIYKKANSKKTL